ncbi:MlaD family protein [Nocardia sp. XZ_19_385]|uniref:MlaD family protein n=1 Tax=Nocardia sp. XZ_19_385 TaxID=2769488 RepID=UPI0018909ED8|nr:MCE family protein [Nocardia sp. XZ_19_385]
MATLTTRSVLWRLALFATTIAVLLLVIITAITRPVGTETTGYRAEFSDVNGLRVGSDVRMYGVGVGKVEAIELSGATAVVEFTVERERPVYLSTVPAIRYQSLTGQRYIDLRQPDRPGERLAPGRTVPLDKTIPSFDLTQLFNGLQPVLREFSPEALNQFTESVLAVIEGNGAGVGPALDAFERMSRYVSDRQTVLSTIVTNLEGINRQIGGRSQYLTVLLRGLAEVFTVFREKLDGLIGFAAVAPSTLGPLNSLLATLGFTETTNPNLDSALRRLFPDPQQALAVLGKLPGLLQQLANLLPPPGPGARADLTCSQGAAALPMPIEVMISGQRIAVCNG